MSTSDDRDITSFRDEHFFLSNYFRCDFDLDSLGRVRSGEHAYNALKTEDPSERSYILAAATPGEAKRRGQSVTLASGWESGGRVNAMLAVVEAKFAESALEEKLRATGDAVLVEGNIHHDNFWGDCACGGDACALPGKNMLGELLMAVRAALPAPVAEPDMAPRKIDDWDGMIEWVADSLADQAAGLAIGFGPSDVRLLVEKNAIVVDDDDESDDNEPLTTAAVCSQIYVLDDDVLLVRRSRVALREIRFVDHNAGGIESDKWFHDDPFGDCTDGYFYTRDRHLAAESAVSWFRDHAEAPTLDQLGCRYEYAEYLPAGTDRADE